MNNRTRELTYIALLVAMMASTALVTIPLGGLPPITLQTMFVFLAGLLLRPSRAFLAMMVYILLGWFGLPVFAGGTSGAGVLLGYTGGFIMAFPIAAWVTSVLKNEKILNNVYVDQFIKLFTINLIIYMIGGAYFMYVTTMSIGPTAAIFVAYIPGDILKMVAAIYVYVSIRSFVTYEHS